MKIDCKKKIINLREEPYKNEFGDITMGTVIADVLGMSKVKGKYRLYKLAETIFKGKEVEVSKEDIALIKAELENTEGYNNVIIGQVLENLEEK